MPSHLSTETLIQKKLKNCDIKQPFFEVDLSDESDEIYNYFNNFQNNLPEWRQQYEKQKKLEQENLIKKKWYTRIINFFTRIINFFSNIKKWFVPNEKETFKQNNSYDSSGSDIIYQATTRPTTASEPTDVPTPQLAPEQYVVQMQQLWPTTASTSVIVINELKEKKLIARANKQYDESKEKQSNSKSGFSK